jgi:uncharacterized protein (DUF58 family)
MAREPAPSFPDFFAQIEAIVLRARGLMAGTLSGVHKSPHRGSSVEFFEHKQYSHGDEIRHIDWKVAARSEKYYIKQFENETNLRAVLALDASGSMGYGEGATHKLRYAVRLAAALAYVLLKQSDAVGLLTQGPSGERRYVPPRSNFSHFRVLADAMQHLAGGGKNGWLRHLEELAGTFHRRSLFVIVSDLLVGDPEPLRRVLRIVRSRRSEMLVLQTLHPDEMEFPFDRTAEFRSLEDARRVLLDPRAIRERYRRELESFLGEMRRFCLESEADYALVRTDQPVERALADLLSAREGP